jgi:AraC-like DNA-binding protein
MVTMSLSLARLTYPIEFAGVLQEAREIGVDAAPLCEFNADDAWNERSHNWGRVMREVRIDGFPIRVARRTSVGEMGPLALAARVAPDLLSALRRLIDMEHVVTGRRLAAGMREDVARGIVTVQLPIGDSDLGWRCRREMLIACGLKFTREILGAWIRPRRACFRHARPRDASEHEAFFDCEVRFDAEYDGLEFARDTLATPLPGADRDMSQFLVEPLAAIADGSPSKAATLEGSVRHAIRERLGKQALAMDAVAQEFGMSTRTLSRRLVERGSSYHEILDGVRRELADVLISDPHNKLSEIALLLGFSDASAFHRAYVRWTGRTPASRRRVR